MGYPRRAELYLELIEKEVEAWKKCDAFPGPGRPTRFDVLALLINPSLEDLLKTAERQSGEPYWDRLKSLDIPVPILIFRTLDDDLWAGLKRDDFEAVFTAVGEQGWSPSAWGKDSLN